MINSREVLSAVKGSLEEWFANSYVTLTDEDGDQRQYRVVQMDEFGLVFEFRPAEAIHGDGERFQVVIGVRKA